jgi:hypothetical protein
MKRRRTPSTIRHRATTIRPKSLSRRTRLRLDGRADGMRDTPHARRQPSTGDTAMRTYRTAIPASIFAISLFATVPAHAERATTDYFDLVNVSFDSVTSVAVAPAGGDAFSAIALGAPLRGGVTSTTVELPHGDCLRDFRMMFADGRTLLYPGIDVCRYRQLRLTPRDGRPG